METVLREAGPGDCEAIYGLNRDAFGYEFALEKTRRRLAEILAAGQDKILVAVREGRVVGYIHGADYDCTYSEPLKNVLALAVDENCRGQGVGRKLLTALEDWARAEGCEGVRLVSSVFRTGAHRFYLACGYTDRKDQKNFVKLFE